MSDDALREVYELQRQVVDLQLENDRLNEILGLSNVDRVDKPPGTVAVGAQLNFPLLEIDHSATPQAKIELFRSLFVGRDDVYAVSWESARTGKRGWSPAIKGGFSAKRSSSQEYLPLTEDVIANHLAGKLHLGLYPLLRDDSCQLLVCDFDGSSWALDALAYVDAARMLGVFAALERSRSGDGAHVWIFFSDRVPATHARRLGTILLREAMNSRGEMDLASYDRLFPTQDFMPKGTFGNLIALPLQKKYRDQGTTVFLDLNTLKPVDDQWAFLSVVPRLSRVSVESIVEESAIVGAGPGENTFQSSYKAALTVPSREISAVADAMLEINRSGLPPALLTALKHLASLHNPAFYEKERLRFSTWDTPRMIRCYDESLESLLLPRGLTEAAIGVVAAAGSRLSIRENRPDPTSIELAVTFQLRDDQERAFREMATHEVGVLVAPPGVGKTVVACALIAHHQRPTLIIVDRQPLVDQWRDRLGMHLGLTTKEIGQIGGGKNKVTGIVDIVMAQSLSRRDDIVEMTSRYGLVVVDECHHVPAVTFERSVRRIRSRRWLGLTATPIRRDGLQGLITMYCGPVRYRMSDATSEEKSFSRKLILHTTAFSASDDVAHIQDLFRALVHDETRTAAICRDIAIASAQGRKCLVLTQWTEHLSSITSALHEVGVAPLVLQGGMGKKAVAKVLADLEEGVRRGGLVLAATGSFLGEGFDCPPLDTLFMAFPIAFRGRVIQYVGRVLRPMEGKSTVEVHDYVDAGSPLLERMQRKRLPGYVALGFAVDKDAIL